MCAFLLKASNEKPILTFVIINFTRQSKKHKRRLPYAPEWGRRKAFLATL